MKLLNKFLGLAILLALFSTSCSSDDDATTTGQVPSAPLGAYENGNFILNEGSSAATAGVDFLSDEGVLTSDVFRIENPDEDELGLFLQNIFFDDTRAFIISGGTSTVTVVNRYTFEYITTIATDFDNPRYGIVANGKAYVTNQAGFSTGADDFVTVINLTNYSTSTVLIGDYMDRITFAGNTVVIANGAFGSGNAITFLNTSDNTFQTLDLGAGNSPNSLVSVDNNVYALTGSNKFFQIDVTTISLTNTIDIPAAISDVKNLQIENDEVYFTADTSVYSFSLGDTSVSTTPLFTYNSTSQFGAMYGFSVSDNSIFIGDAGDFASAGTFFEYTTAGILVNSYTSSGVGPNGFYNN
tara:strand:- start:776 stop:1840 length:1065 start_codon:yes stop_codon:yes gene_type:complete